MRFSTLAVIALTATTIAASPSLAATKHTYAAEAPVVTAEAAPTFDDCFRLAWVRGVHVERFELDDFDSECMAGRVPFDSGMAVDSVKRETHQHEPHS